MSARRPATAWILLTVCRCEDCLRRTVPISNAGRFTSEAEAEDEAARAAGECDPGDRMDVFIIEDSE